MSDPSPARGKSPLRSLLGIWALALALSTVLVVAGQHWPQPLVPDSRWVWGLVLGPPLLMALWLLSGLWVPASAADR